jgi:ribosomal-protein-alanine N-acetyltransferase
MDQPSPEQIRRILSVDPVWSAYALADLQPNFEQYCQWYVSEDGDEAAVALIFTGLKIPTLFTVGTERHMVEAVAQIDLPESVYITIPDGHFDHIASLYDFSGDRRPMWRMFLPTDVSVDLPAAPGLRPMTSADVENLNRLYAHGGSFAPDAFEAYQLDNGVFFGVENGDGGLISAGGTHILDWTQGIGTIGNMYTRPDQRGKGYAAAVLQGIVLALRQGDVDNIVLNVDQRNPGAKRLYEKYGFEGYGSYVEGIGKRK